MENDKGLKVFNTNKVAIGLNYTPPPYVEQSTDMLKLQGALIHMPDEVGNNADWDGVCIALFCLIAIGGVLVPFWAR